MSDDLYMDAHLIDWNNKRAAAMSQLSDEQIKAIKEILAEISPSIVLADSFVEKVQKKLKPLPSYAEISRKGRINASNPGVPILDINPTSLTYHAEEAGAQAVIAAYREREIVPVIKQLIIDLNVQKQGLAGLQLIPYNNMVDACEKLIGVSE